MVDTLSERQTSMSNRKRFFAQHPKLATGFKASTLRLKTGRTASTTSIETPAGTGAVCRFVMKSGKALDLTLRSLEEDSDGYVYGERPTGRVVAFHRDNIDYMEEL